MLRRVKRARMGERGLGLAAALTLLVGCEPPPIRVVHHVPPGGQALPPLADVVPLNVRVASVVFDDPYAWLERSDRSALDWKNQQLDFSRAWLDAIPAPPNARETYLS